MTLYIGLISGTSMDAIDAALVDLAPALPRLVSSHRHDIPTDVREDLLRLIRATAPPAKRVWRLDARLGAVFADAALALMRNTGIRASEVHALGSHGQTVFHDPDHDPPCTVQLGDPSVIAERTRITTVADFRRRDLAAGGQGAPLVPAFHQAVFRAPGVERVVLNLGGIANVTIVPASPTESVTGFDTGPGNTLLDVWSLEHTGEPLDAGGAWAESGTLERDLLRAMLQDPYLRRSPPKSTGRERYNLGWITKQLSKLPATPPPANVQRTLCELTAASVGRDVEQYAAQAQEVLVCGGGVHNPVLMRALTGQLAPRRVQSTAALGVDPDWVEAMAFAWLARETLARRPGNVPAVTGARHPAVLGGVYYA